MEKWRRVRWCRCSTGRSGLGLEALEELGFLRRDVREELAHGALPLREEHDVVRVEAHRATLPVCRLCEGLGRGPELGLRVGVRQQREHGAVVVGQVEDLREGLGPRGAGGGEDHRVDAAEQAVLQRVGVAAHVRDGPRDGLDRGGDVDPLEALPPPGPEVHEGGAEDGAEDEGEGGDDEHPRRVELVERKTEGKDVLHSNLHLWTVCAKASAFLAFCQPKRALKRQRRLHPSGEAACVFVGSWG